MLFKKRFQKKRTLLPFILVFLLCSSFCPSTASASNQVSNWGRLSVKGTHIVNKKGKAVVLKGVSTHGIAWFPQYVNKEQFASWKKFGANTIRLAFYSNKADGYSRSLYSTIDKGIQAATELGMYVIIDWHILQDGNPQTNQKEAAYFFTRMAKKYHSQSNILYEICNEPNGNVTWEHSIKPYAKKIIKVIRKYDKNSIIIVGTPTWSQDVDTVSNSPLQGEKNIMYTLHFYAATHNERNRSKLQAALKKNLPVFVTEFSICDASGTGPINKSEAQKWMKLLKKNKISYIAWNISNKNETSALIKSNCNKTKKIKKSDLSSTGKWFIKQLKSN